MKLIFIAYFAFAIIAAQGFSVTNNTWAKLVDSVTRLQLPADPGTINKELIKKFIDAVLERARLAMRPGFEINNQHILTTMDPFAQRNIEFDLEALKYVVYDFYRCIAIIRFYPEYRGLSTM